MLWLNPGALATVFYIAPPMPLPAMAAHKSLSRTAPRR